MKGRTVILVVSREQLYCPCPFADRGRQTHNISLAAPISKFIVSVKDGHVFPQDSIEDAIKSDSTIAAEIKEEDAKVERAEEEIDLETKFSNTAHSNAGKLIVAEDTEEGHVSWTSCKRPITLYFHRLNLVPSEKLLRGTWRCTPCPILPWLWHAVYLQQAC